MTNIEGCTCNLKISFTAIEIFMAVVVCIEKDKWNRIQNVRTKRNLLILRTCLLFIVVL